ncbi:bifunctional peptidase and arginyl-hydroxylase JMJD5 isoform X2 [Malaya genurostris]|uniref:bifunctional peptidase and arginyl-hydroxylase JMJD5 isoform X2 n=1 Tax=Malaya genurostris TaxID=325434 RepID=UPI0026F3E367|nr:bifunctional peptidase and arginyl-hydroxylase JMJD5 isoform X2 [Malaya genurostris]
MAVLKALLGLFPTEDFFMANLAINSQNLYRDVIRIVIQPFIGELANDFEKLKGSECAHCNLIRIGTVYDLLYACLHTGEWSVISAEERELFTIFSYLRIIYMMLCIEESAELFSDAIYAADIGLMLGSRVSTDPSISNLCLLTEVATVLTSVNKKQLCQVPMKKIKIDLDDKKEVNCDIQILYCPTLEHFGSQYYDKAEPVLLRGVIDDWPAMQKWHDLNYLIKLAGERTVPVEIGSQYSNDDWSQRLVKFKDFVVDNLGETVNCATPKNCEKSVYLAQHELFDQIPKLKEDIFVPDYIGRTDVSPRIKAWLGPRGTISPLHTDPSHNLLCQVFGSKTIVLASPLDTPNLYPHEHFILNNTSQLNMKSLDFNQFPKARAVQFRRLVLRRGEVLYIPPDWWHYVESLAPSFSVSFWFD